MEKPQGTAQVRISLRGAYRLGRLSRPQYAQWQQGRTSQAAAKAHLARAPVCRADLQGKASPCNRAAAGGARMSSSWGGKGPCHPQDSQMRPQGQADRRGLEGTPAGTGGHACPGHRPVPMVQCPLTTARGQHHHPESGQSRWVQLGPPSKALP